MNGCGEKLELDVKVVNGVVEGLKIPPNPNADDKFEKLLALINKTPSYKM